MKRFLLFILLLPSFLSATAQLNTDYLMSVGRNALYFEDYVLSIQYFNQAIKAKPYLTEAYYFRGIAKIYLEDYVGAEDDFSAAVERNPFMPMAYYARGFARKNLNKLDLAATDFSKALEFSPENATYLFNRIEVYDRQKRYDEELSDIDFLLKRGRFPIELSLEKGRVLLMQGDTLGAFSVINATTKLDTTSAEVWGARATLYLIREKNDSALADYNRAIRLGAQNPSFFGNRGIIRYLKKDYRGALDDYDRAIALNPDDEQTLFNRSLLRTEVGDYNNAITDLNKVVNLNPDKLEAVYQRAVIEQRLGFHEKAIDDYSTVIVRYPNFVPAFYARAQSYEATRQHQAAYNDMSVAFKLNEENQKNKNKKKTADEEPDTKVQLAKEPTSSRERTKLFTQSENGTTEESRYKGNSLRGTIQNQRVEAQNMAIFVLSYYQRETQIRTISRFDSTLNAFNEANKARGALKLVCEEMPLTNAMINYHFKAIQETTERLQNNDTDANLYFERAIDYALVQDLNSSIADFSSAINHGAGALAYFCRANMRYKQMEVAMANNDEPQSSADAKNPTDKKNTLSQEKRYALENELIMRDYDRAIALNPRFSYAWYNRGNVLCLMRDYRAAVSNYSRAIAYNPDLAEAYFNRGLVYIYLGEVENGISDLSKAGELGIYQAYALLKKMR